MGNPFLEKTFQYSGMKIILTTETQGHRELEPLSCGSPSRISVEPQGLKPWFLWPWAARLQAVPFHGAAEIHLSHGLRWQGRAETHSIKNQIREVVPLLFLSVPLCLCGECLI